MLRFAHILPLAAALLWLAPAAVSAEVLDRGPTADEVAAEMMYGPQPPAASPEVSVAADDPCAGFAATRAGYDSCVDRMKKIKRMRDAAMQREEDLKGYYRRLETRTAPKPEPQAAAPAVAEPKAR